MPRKSGKSGAVKGETITIRVPPKTKFALEMAARKKHTSITSVVLNVITPFLASSESGLTVFIDSEDGNGKKRVLIQDVAWDPREPDRLVKLARSDESLLTYDEEIRWNVIKENPGFWGGDAEPLYGRIRDQWDEICKEAELQLNKFSSV